MRSQNLSRLMLSCAVVVVTACSAGTGNGGDGSMGGGDGGQNDILIIGEGSHFHDVVFPDINIPDVTINPDAYFYMDPPPEVCYADGGMGAADVLIGGTAMCPADKNLPGCPCLDPSDPTGQTYYPAGTTMPCFQGPRADRNRGICRDGMTTCMMSEAARTWGPCQGEVLPAAGATTGAQACGCFSTGTWHIDNVTPCLIPPDMCGGMTGAESSYISSIATCGQPIVECQPVSGGCSGPAPSQAFSTDTLTVDCAGTYHLCWTLKAGDFNAANNQSDPHMASADCVIGQSCVDTVYPDPGAMPGSVQTLPPLLGWTSQTTDPNGTCTLQMYNSGGYFELSVVLVSSACETLGTDSSPYVFLRENFCPFAWNCNTGYPACSSTVTTMCTNSMCSMCGNGTTAHL